MRRFIFVVLAASACGEAPWPRIVPEPARPATAPPQSPRHDLPQEPAVGASSGAMTLSAELLAALAPVYASNDALHEALAGDRFDAVPAVAAKLGDAALMARKSTQEQPLAARLGEVEAQARALAAKTDPEATRRAYGELSRLLVALATDIPALRDGRFVFMCPMASGYQKWMQRQPSLRNPYFGAKMLTCGESSDWRP